MWSDVTMKYEADKTQKSAAIAIGKSQKELRLAADQPKSQGPNAQKIQTFPRFSAQFLSFRCTEVNLGSRKFTHFERIMLKAIQILGSSSSGFVSYTLRKPHPNCNLSFISIKSIQSSSKATSPGFLLRYHTGRSSGYRSYRIRMYSFHPESKSDGASSSPSGGAAPFSSASSAAVQPTVSS